MVVWGSREFICSSAAVYIIIYNLSLHLDLLNFEMAWGETLNKGNPGGIFGGTKKTKEDNIMMISITTVMMEKHFVGNDFVTKSYFDTNYIHQKDEF